MLKIGQNWSKIENYPPNAQQRFAPLTHNTPILVSEAVSLTTRPLIRYRKMLSLTAEIRVCQTTRTFLQCPRIIWP